MRSGSASRGARRRRSSCTRLRCAPDARVEFCVAGNDFVLERMAAVAQDEFAIDGDIADRGAVEAENDERQEIVGRVTRNREVAQVDCKEIGGGAGTKVARGYRERARAVHGGAFEETLGERDAADVIENGSLLMLEAEVVVELACVFERINLCLAVGAERDTDASLHGLVRGQDAVAEVALGSGTGTEGRAGIGEGAQLVGCG